ncbi:KAP family P-loop NTPase fold protein [Pseudotamlana agarivorans]|uniref:KAP family P-loop NTPase fold protein n=1 Tax=Pseudotamlana agarivorans TaxID=481183 RepID=UPI00082F887D|nr:P-loop NTPase fold protein [Tamlana agarivorans]
MIKSSITDSPRNLSNGELDNFGIEPFENGLTKFINLTNTPITIALQGEWGSGKTSLMNSLKKNLSDSNDSKYFSIWLNTWEYALMKDASSTLIDIISKLIDEVSKIANVEKERKNKMLKSIRNIGFSTLKVASSLNSITNSAMNEIEKSLNQEEDITISQIRDELEQIIEKCIQDKNKQGIIFFIDDLDRIDPPVAVQLLELLKNIFTLKNCVFVLAIDYDVVIKGLEPKFGKLSELNEREFRSFFDKIIQVPFSMPVSRYETDKFLKESLLSTNYINEENASNVELIAKFSEISNLSVGKNPRALKRLMNSLSLISCINSTKVLTEENDQLNNELELLVNFALVSIQIAYPPVYRLLSLHSGFDKWNESVALQMNLKELDQQSIDKLNQSEEFDEEWEKILFRLCENDHYLKKRALNISRLLNSLKKSITEKEEEIEDIIGAVISLSSVTNLEAFDKPVVDYHKGWLLKEIRNRLFPVLKKKIPNANDIKQIGTRIQSNFKFYINKGVNFHMSSYPKDGKINLYINTNVWYGNDINDFRKDLENNNLLAEFESIKNEFDTYSKTSSDFITQNLFDLGNWKNHYYINFHSDLILSKPEDFFTEETIEKISDHIIKLKEFRTKVLVISNKRNNK